LSFDDWDGYERLLQPNHEICLDEWLHFVSQETPDYMEEHQEAIDEDEQQFRVYMMAYGADKEYLVNPDVKYDLDGRIR
jgi:hypothetical protein